MFTTKLISALVLVSAVLSVDIDCDPCQCWIRDSVLINADCSVKTLETELTNMVGNFSHSIDKLDLSGQPLKTLTENMFQIANLTNLSGLRIKNCLISEINKKAFTNMTNLKILDASNNNISVIDNEVLFWLKALEELDLSQNMIKKIPDLKNLTRLEDLNLEHNKIQFLDDNTFVNNSNIISLQLSYNKIEMISKGAFGNLRELKFLHISHNSLTRLPENIFQNTTNLHSLKLENNSIVSIPEKLLENLTHITILDFDSNRIRVIPNNLCANKLKLLAIYFANNQIEVIPKNAFTNLKNLNILDLSNNKIKYLDSGILNNEICMSNIFDFLGPAALHVHLHHNNINSLPSKILGRTCYFSASLDLSYNNISNIDVNAFDSFIAELDLSHNQITFLYKDTFNNDVIFMDLSYNNLTILPDEIFKRVIKLKLNNNNLNTFSYKWFDTVLDLTLNNNNITYFDLQNKTIRELNLLNNTLNCDCTMRKQYERYNYSTIECFTPLSLKGKKWSELKLEEFACEPKLLETITKTNNDITSEIACKVYGSPTPHIRWIKNNETLLDNDTNLIKSTLDEPDDIHWYNLTFSNETKDDISGQYYCELSNYAGTVKMNFTVMKPEGSTVHVGTAIGITAVVLVLIGLHVVLVLFYFKRLKRNYSSTTTDSNLPYETVDAEEVQAMV